MALLRRSARLDEEKLEDANRAVGTLREALEVDPTDRKAGAEMSDIDGVRVRTEDGWWLLRASNTQDVLVARAEARDEAGLKRLKALIVDELARSGIAPPPF